MLGSIIFITLFVYPCWDELYSLPLMSTHDGSNIIPIQKLVCVLVMLGTIIFIHYQDFLRKFRVQLY